MVTLWSLSSLAALTGRWSTWSFSEKVKLPAPSSTSVNTTRLPTTPSISVALTTCQVTDAPCEKMPVAVPSTPGARPSFTVPGSSAPMFTSDRICAAV
ncbi:hypothetical protein CI41S_71770 [Bradyrhizobium ivorense]|nr:hypothetical protein CI41S_71730 [Bradyrhizobium ivorense]VIO80232.1 hypothetical protein CI41S_71770 [Bradyrhizobium ivorense]